LGGIGRDLRGKRGIVGRAWGFRAIRRGDIRGLLYGGDWLFERLIYTELAEKGWGVGMFKVCLIGRETGCSDKLDGE